MASTSCKAFIEALKDHLAGSTKNYITKGDNPWANGCTRTGFYPDTVVDMEELFADIDAFAATFKETQSE